MMDYKKAYYSLIERLKEAKGDADICDERYCCVIDGLIQEPDYEDERIRKAISQCVEDMRGQFEKLYSVHHKDAIAWLEKHGTPAKLSEEEQNRFAKCVLSECASSFIKYLEAHKYEGKMCVSNGECEDIENAFHNAMWDRLHRYYCKFIEKQGIKPQGKSALEAIHEQNPDAEKKELVKIEQEPTDADNKFIKMHETKPKNISEFLDRLTTVEQEFLWEHIAKIRELDKEEQKSSWSEGDKRIMSAISQLLKDCESENGWNCVYSNDREVFFVDIEKWLQSLKDKFSTNQDNLSGNDEINYRILQAIICNSDTSSILANKLSDWIESLKNKVTPQQKEWSEEDEQIALSIEQVINCAALLNIVPEKISKIRTWLQSLKQRVIWKPTANEKSNIESAKSIPITPKILQKNGFELKPDGWIWCKDDGNEEQNYIFIQFRKGCDEVRTVELNFVGKVQGTFRQVQDVYELQNLLNVCHIKKEIEL